MTNRILIVDDDASVRHMLKLRLEANQFVVLSASNGIEGLKLVDSEKPDPIILDVMLPQLNGYAFLKELRHRNVGPDIPVIILTAKEAMRELFELEGIADYVVKPYDAKNLLDKVKKHLSLKEDKTAKEPKRKPKQRIPRASEQSGTQSLDTDQTIE